MSDRRKSKRWLLNAYYETYSEDNENTIGYLAEVSEEGIMLMNEEPLPPNIIMPLRISLNEEVGEPTEMRVVAKVMRSQKDADLNWYNTGFKLVDISGETHQIIEQLIELGSFEKPSE